MIRLTKKQTANKNVSVKLRTGQEAILSRVILMEYLRFGNSLVTPQIST